MNKLTLFVLLLFCGLSSFSQFHANFEAGGSNFLGGALTAEYRIDLFKSKSEGFLHKTYLSPKVGIGQVFAFEPALTTQFGLGFGKYLKHAHSLELSSNFSYLTKTSITKNEPDPSSLGGDNLYESSIYWYSGLDYKINGRKQTSLYCRTRFSLRYRQILL